MGIKGLPVGFYGSAAQIDLGPVTHIRAGNHNTTAAGPTGLTVALPTALDLPAEQPAPKPNRATRRARKGIAPRNGPENNAALIRVCQLAGLPIPKEEQTFYPGRDWKVDLMWRAVGLIVEIEGGIWIGGRHVHPPGFIEDMRKYNQMDLLGWDLIRVLPDWIDTGEALALLQDYFAKRAPGRAGRWGDGKT